MHDPCAPRLDLRLEHRWQGGLIGQRSERHGRQREVAPDGGQEPAAGFRHAEDEVLRHTEVSSPALCPEIRLHLVTERCPLWRAGERELQALGLADPYWAFCWPGGQALARHLLDHPELVAGKRVLDFGAGGAVEAIAALWAGAACACAADIDPLAVIAATLNAELNGVTLETTTSSLLGTPPEDWDVVLAGDVCYGEELTREVIAWLRAHARLGHLVLLADPGRGYLPPEALLPCQTYLAPADVDPSGGCRVPTTIYRVLER